MALTTNDFRLKGLGNDRNWLSPFQLLDNSDPGNVVFQVTSAGAVSLGLAAGLLDLSAVTAANPELKVRATSDTPTVAFTDNGTASHAPTTAPAGYIKILDASAVAAYIPFWR